VGIPRDFYSEDLDPEIERTLEDTIDLLKREGVVFVEVELPDQAPLSAAARIIQAVEAAALHKPWMLTRRQDYGAQVRARLEHGLVYTGTQYFNALRWRSIALTEHLAAARNVDALLLPVTRRAAPTLAESDFGGSHEAEIVIQAITCFLRPVNYLGLPALVFPAGTAKTGMPIGVQLVGKPFGEAILLRLGAGFQRVTDFHTRVPDFPPAG
jgi:aspartyl-tRNA(Asn)/glutamyl-tRNA(Gln) amidotransferase subunit A